MMIGCLCWSDCAVSAACIATTLLPTQPLVWLRNEGAVGEYPPSAAWFLWRDKLSPSQFPQWAKLHTSLALMDDEAALRVLNELWEVSRCVLTRVCCSTLCARR